MNALLKRTVVAILALGLTAMATVSGAQQEKYPTKPITIVVPFAAGGPVDIVARGIADPMARLLRQPVVIENIAGAAGAVGAVKAMRAPADGYTLLLGHSGTHAFNVALNPGLPYRPLEDFRPVALLASMPSVLSVNSKSSFTSVNDLIAFARQNPGKLNFGNAGNGSASHLAALSLIDAARIDVSFIPYRGSNPAFTDLIGGQIDALFDTSVQAVPQTQGGRVRALAVTAKKRIPELPKVPTLQESCCEKVAVEIWYGLFAQKDIPPQILRTIESAVLASLADQKYRTTMLKSSVILPDIAKANRDEFEVIIRRDIVQFTDLAKRTGAKAAP